ncbi:hypothetical protein CANARDRAFT_173932 [[Candida] arabinofermentans NRRL YB-2248]|uniref:ATP-dependent helicase IRC3 n=1 Tax=[Candida] arabinofermentans NRRL YB-2248 TaxID=983967 RepID=A0A1E4T8I4_9ASCO|nr:hypothetical protein CANARDRAFT_173932 [[Candida] arabinofermentans NRRL YB-2248]
MIVGRCCLLFKRSLSYSIPRLAVSSLSTTTSRTPDIIIDNHIIPTSTTDAPPFAILRDYQQECVDSCLDALNESRRIAVSLATGGGKTVIFTHLIDQLPLNSQTGGKKSLILVHRKELADQAVKSIQRFFPNYKVEMDMAKYKPSHSNDVDVIVASVPTLARSIERLQLYNPMDYKGIIIDECHHGVSNSYLKVLKHFGCDDSKTIVPVIGFSATLKRHDKLSLKKVFDQLVFHRGMEDLIKQGFLSDFTWAKVKASFKLNEVELGSNGDYKIDSLAEHVNTEQNNELVLKTYIHFQKNNNLKSSLFFCANVDHMVQLSELFRINGINAQYVTGNTLKRDRENLVNDFKNGQIPVLMNCGVFTEGTDIPNIDSIFMVRPTKSKPLLIQMLGRGLRLHENKSKCLIVDFVDASMSGIHLEATLKGQQTSDPRLKGVFPPDENNGLKKLPKESQDFEFVEYESIEGYQEMMNRTKNIKDIYEQNITAQFRQNKYPWVQLRRDCWGLRVSSICYYKIEQDSKKNIHRLTWVVKAFKGTFKFFQNNEIYSSNDLQKVFNSFEEHFTSDSDKMNLYYRNQYYGQITQRQKEFIIEKIEKVALKSKKIDHERFKNELNEHLSKLSKQDASQLIFIFTISGSKGLQIYIKNNFLNKKEARDELLL